MTSGRIVPKRLMLIEMRDGVAHDCEVRWRSPSAIGVFFFHSFSLDGSLPEEMQYLMQIWAGANATNTRAAEITPEAIHAGVAAYRAWTADNIPDVRVDQDMVRVVGTAMLQTMRKHQVPEGDETLRRLREEHGQMQRLAYAALTTHGMNSEEFRVADAATSRIWDRLIQTLEINPGIDR